MEVYCDITDEMIDESEPPVIGIKAVHIA